MNCPTITPTRVTPNPSHPGAQLVHINCPHCGREHTHGLPAGETRAGHRHSHCGRGNGYYIDAMPHPRPVTDPPEPCEQCRARDLADDPDAPSSRRDCDCAEVPR